MTRQLRLPFRPTLHQLLHSALFADSILTPIGTDDVCPPRRVYLSTAGKSKDQIVREFAVLLRKAGMLKD